MKKIVRQNIGIDISKKTFIACYCMQDIDGMLTFSTPVQFNNNRNGLNRFVKWVRKFMHSDAGTGFTMEATGVYHELVAVHLHKLNFPVSVVLPNKVKYYAKSLNIKTKTDGVDAKVIARMGIEQKLSLWNPPAAVYQKLRSLTRYLQELKKQKTAAGNHLEALTYSEFCEDFVFKSYQDILHTIEAQITACERKIRECIQKDEVLAAKVKKIETVDGVGLATIAVIVAETQGFTLFTGRKQLASYAGLDIVERQSGTSVRGKPHISKKGNKRIRAALYFPALSASVHNQSLREDYLRIIQSKPYKKIGIVALQRKLLLLIYTLWKKDEEFCPLIKDIRDLGGEVIPSSSGCKTEKKTGSCNGLTACTG